MRHIDSFIQEAIDVENLFWKINSWYDRRPDEKNDFKALVDSFKGKLANKNSVEQWLTAKGKNPKAFIDFMSDDAVDSGTKDYLYLMCKVIDNINANKSEEL